MKTIEKSLREMCDTSKCSNVIIMGVSEALERERDNNKREEKYIKSEKN